MQFPPAGDNIRVQSLPIRQLGLVRWREVSDPNAAHLRRIIADLDVLIADMEAYPDT